MTTTGRSPGQEHGRFQVVSGNFVLPLAKIHYALAPALYAPDGDALTVVIIRHERCVSPVDFEWLGIPRSLKGGTAFGARSTGADALLVAFRSTLGNRRQSIYQLQFVRDYPPHGAIYPRR